MKEFPDVNDWETFLKDIGEFTLDIQTLIEGQDKAVSAFETIEKLLQQEIGEALDTPLPKGYLIGKFEVVEEIGKGGMSRVYLARRHDGLFDQQVAIKLLSRDLVDEKHQEYFDKERKILARLNHPNISKILDGGITKDSIPYLVMEYVEGVPLDEYLQNNSCTLNDRITIFLRICEAVRHAHGQLILHRDLKPSNVFIDRENRVRLLDFGIGGFISEVDELGEGGTLLYLPPEHVNSNQYTVQSDIYQLGLLAYRIFEGHDAIFGSTSEEVVQKIKNGNFSTWKNLQSNRTLRAIISKCLQTDPENRYSTVDAVIIDFKFYLEDKPVKALPESRLHNGFLFLKRNRIGASFSFLLFALVFSFAVWSNIQSGRIKKEKERALAANEFLTRIFKANDPDFMKGKELTVASLLESSGKELEKIESPIVRSEMLNKIGEVYASLGLWDRAMPLFNEVLLLKESFPISEEQVVKSYTNLSNSHRNMQEIALADSTIDLALELLDGEQKKNSYTFSDLLYYKSDILIQLGEYRKADSVARMALAATEDISSNYFSQKNCVHENPDVHKAMVLTILCQSLIRQTKLEEALQTGQKALELVEKNKPESVSYSLYPYYYLAETYNAMGLHKKELKLYQYVVDENIKAFGPDHPDTWNSMGSLAIAHGQLNNFQQCDSLNSFLYEKYREFYGPSASRTLTRLFYMVRSSISQEKYDEAKSAMIKVLEGDIQNLGNRHIYIGDDHEQLGIIETALGNYTKAEEHLRMSHKIFDENIGEKDSRFVTLYRNFGNVYRESGKYKLAEEYYDRSLSISKEILGESHEKHEETQKQKDILMAKMNVTTYSEN